MADKNKKVKKGEPLGLDKPASSYVTEHGTLSDAEAAKLRKENPEKALGLNEPASSYVTEGPKFFVEGDVNMSAGGLIPPNKRTGNIDYRKTGLVRNKRDNKRKGMK
tara:strand:- start:701 stop:1021 length:321 start_codon:yes stop_codon:yes gene_type:complete